MIDIKFLRENPDAVKENIKKKFQDHKLPLVDQVIELDEQSRAVKKQADELRSNRNKISKMNTADLSIILEIRLDVAMILGDYSDKFYN